MTTLEILFFVGTAVFGCVWIPVIFLYLFKIVPEVKKRRGLKTIVEAGLQLNFAGNIRRYGIIAKETNDRAMLKIYHLVNILVVVAILVFLITVLSTIAE
jgi:hypothetical protein